MPGVQDDAATVMPVYGNGWEVVKDFFNRLLDWLTGTPDPPDPPEENHE